MRSLWLALLTCSFAAPAETVWWHVAGADVHHRRVLEQVIGDTLGRRAYPLGQVIDDAVTADYLISAVDVDAAEASVAAFNPLYTQVRRSTDNPERWTPSLMWMREPNSASGAAFTVLAEANDAIRDLEMLLRKFQLFLDLRSRGLKDPGIVPVLLELGRAIFRRLDEIRLPEVDAFILAQGTALGWAAAPVIESDPRYLRGHLSELRRAFREAPRARDHFDPNHAEFKGVVGTVELTMMERLGVNRVRSFAPRASPPDERLPFVTLALPDRDAVRDEVVAAVRSLYAPLTEQLAAKNAYDLLAAFRRGRLEDADPEHTRKLWDAREKRVLPAGAVAHLSEELGWSKADTRKIVRLRAQTVVDRARPVVAHQQFYEVVTDLANAAVHVRRAHPGDPTPVKRYFENAIYIFQRLVETDPPSDPGAMLALLDGALRLGENFDDEYPPGAKGRPKLARAYERLRKSVDRRIAEINFATCGATLELALK